MKNLFVVFTVLALLTSSVSAGLTEDFDALTDLDPPATDGNVTADGWFGALRSDPLGTTGIFSMDDAFDPNTGASYAAMNFENTDPDGVGDISTWLMTPELILTNGDTYSFYTRTTTDSDFADALEVRLSTAGASTDVGTAVTDVGDFTTLLLEINSALDPSGYPDTWTQFSGTISGLSGGETGRIAMRYAVPNGGGFGDNSNYIGIDTFATTANAVPEPSTIALVGLGILGLSVIGRRRQ